MLGNEVVEIQRGQWHTSELKLTKRWGWSRNKVRGFLSLICNMKMSTIQSTTKGTTITIANYDFFQDTQTTQGIEKKQRKDNEKTAQGTRTKNVNNEKEFLIEIPAELKPSVDAFIEMRKSINKPITEKVLKMILAKVDELSKGDTIRANKIIDQSTMNSWASVFRLKEETDKQNKAVCF